MLCASSTAKKQTLSFPWAAAASTREPTSEQRGRAGVVMPELGCVGVQCPLSWQPLSGAGVSATQLAGREWLLSHHLSFCRT